MKLLASLIFSFSVLLPGAAFAQGISVDDTGLTETASGVYSESESIAVIIGRIIQVALGLVGFIFFIMVLYAGILWMTAGGNSDQADKARKLIANAAIGLVIIVAAYAITTAVINGITQGTLAPGSAGTEATI